MAPKRSMIKKIDGGAKAIGKGAMSFFRTVGIAIEWEQDLDNSNCA
jgi:hypothetical protein